MPEGIGQESEPAVDYLKVVRACEEKGQKFVQETLRPSWDRSYRAFRNEHFQGSKYFHKDYRNRSKLFRAKTRTAVRKSDAAAVASLFSTTDAVKCTAGNENDPQQVAAASLLHQLLLYRTDRTSGQASMPWFRLCAGAHQQAMLQSACISKQYWLLEMRKIKTETVQQNDGTGQMVDVNVEHWTPYIDRPDSQLHPLENIVIDPSASWLNPIQSAGYLIVKHPMSLDEVKVKQNHPQNPWKAVDVSSLRGTKSADKDGAATRNSREGGSDRLDQRFTGDTDFEVVWVYEVFIRLNGEDMCFWSAQDRAYLTDPKPVREVYPEQGGERPYTFGITNLEAHRLFPMSPVESWQQSQMEINDFANLTLDQAKLSVAPVTKVVRGKNVDLDALLRRGPQSQVLVENKDDVTWEKEPGPDAGAFAIIDRLNSDFDDQAGQFNSGSVQTNRSLNETVGGLKLISGAADAVQEFDLRVWIETWVEPTLGQILKLEQYYEHDETILALCGDRAQLFPKVSVIDEALLQQQVLVRVDAGIGNADPAQKLQKLGGAVAMLAPMVETHPDFVSGKLKVNIMSLGDEIFALAGYRDGAKRFIEVGQPQQQGPPPDLEATIQKLMAEAKDKEASAMLKGAQAGKVVAETAAVKTEAVATMAGVHQGREETVHRMRMDKHGAVRDAVNDHHGRKNTEADRLERREERAQAAQEPKSETQGSKGPAPQFSPEEAAMLKQLIAALKQGQAGATSP